MIELPDIDRSNVRGEKWYDCIMCGTRIKKAEVFFDSGSVEPTEDESFTGATSGHTGVVVDYEIYTGTIAGGDATGVVTLKTLTGVSRDSDTLVETMFQDNETITGSTGGADMMTVNGTPQVNKYGRHYAEGNIVVFRGKRYCRAHFPMKWRHKLIDEIPLDITEEDRGTLW